MSQFALAHPVSISSARVDLTPRQLRIELDIMFEDLVLYHNLAADGQMQYSTADLNAAAKKHRQFVLDYFAVLDVDGNKLPCRIAEESFEQIGDDPVPQGELMKRTVGYLLIIDLEKEKPEFLTFLQTFGGTKSALPSLMDLYITRSEVFEESAQISNNRPHTVKIDWNRNLDGKKLSFAELRKLRKDQLRDRLGIGSFTGLYSFLYINRFEVRHEILVPLMTMNEFCPVERVNSDFLEVDEQAKYRTAVEEFFKTHGAVTINGQVVQPNIQRVSFFSLDIADFALNADPRRIGIHQGRVGVIVSYPSEHVPEKVTVTWDDYNDFVTFIDMTLLIGNDPPERNYFYPQKNSYEWEGKLIGPIARPVKAVQKLDNPASRIDVSQKLLENIYGAFDFRQDEQVYDNLASSVQGDLLRELYLKVKRSLMLAEQGGDLSHATQIKVIDSKVRSGQSNLYETVWQVTSVSEHWGHIHTRTSEYRADLMIQQHEGNWKLERFVQLDEKRMSFETSIRGNDKNK